MSRFGTHWLPVAQCKMAARLRCINQLVPLLDCLQSVSEHMLGAQYISSPTLPLYRAPPSKPTCRPPSHSKYIPANIELGRVALSSLLRRQARWCVWRQDKAHWVSCDNLRHKNCYISSTAAVTLWRQVAVCVCVFFSALPVVVQTDYSGSHLACVFFT